MEALEAKMTSMLDLFEEEKMKTEARLMKERQERMHGEDHVKQLQAELQEQRKIADEFPEDLDEEGGSLWSSMIAVAKDWRKYVKWRYTREFHPCLLQHIVHG